MSPSIETMEKELIRAGWTLLDLNSTVWRAPNEQLYTGVEYCWRIMKGDQWSKQLVHR